MLLQQFIQNPSKDSKMQDYQKNDSKYNGRWTKQQHLKFLQGLRIYGKNWKKIEQLVMTRTGSQIRSHAQKFFLKNKTTEAPHQSDLYHCSGDIHDSHEQISGNSKSFGEGSLNKEDLSYYLGKIVEYSTGRSNLDFWRGLVDCKEATDISQQQIRKNSFINFEDEEDQEDLHQHPKKKVKV